MNKMFNKVMSIAIALTLTLSLAACGGATKTAEKTGGDAAATETKKDDTKKDDAKQEEKVKLRIFSQYSLPE